MMLSTTDDLLWHHFPKDPCYLLSERPNHIFQGFAKPNHNQIIVAKMQKHEELELNHNLLQHQFPMDPMVQILNDQTTFSGGLPNHNKNKLHFPAKIFWPFQRKNRNCENRKFAKREFLPNCFRQKDVEVTEHLNCFKIRILNFVEKLRQFEGTSQQESKHNYLCNISQIFLFPLFLCLQP